VKYRGCPFCGLPSQKSDGLPPIWFTLLMSYATSLHATGNGPTASGVGSTVRMPAAPAVVRQAKKTYAAAAKCRGNRVSNIVSSNKNHAYVVYAGERVKPWKPGDPAMRFPDRTTSQKLTDALIACKRQRVVANRMLRVECQASIIISPIGAIVSLLPVALCSRAHI
jgi:hypothetical protein